MLLSYIFAVVRNYERYEVPFTWRTLGRAFARSGLALLIPIILVGGIVSGIWGTVEAGAITALTAFIIGKVIYRTLSWREFRSAVKRAVVTTSSVFIIIAAAGPFGWLDGARHQATAPAVVHAIRLRRHEAPRTWTQSGDSYPIPG